MPADAEIQAAIHEILSTRLWPRTYLAERLRRDNPGWLVNEAMIRKWAKGTHVPLDRNRVALLAGLERYRSVGQLTLTGLDKGAP